MIKIRTIVTVMNSQHFPIEVSGFIFPPGVEKKIEIETNSGRFRNIRAARGLRINKSNNQKLINDLHSGHEINFVYDAPSPNTTYGKVIRSLSDPIIKHLPKGVAGYHNHPVIGMNVRFFSKKRIIQHGKCLVGPNDVFISHGIGDKDYWIAPHISSFSHALVPGPAWKERIEKGGYKGQVHVTGYTKLDPIFQGEYTRQKREKPYVVWAPTHAYNKSFKNRTSYPECNKLIKEIPNCYETGIAYHPSARREKDITMQELLDADVVIADAGSTIYEAWALGKPVIFPDWICKKGVLGKFSPGNIEYEIYDKGIGYHANSMNELIDMIETALVKGMQTAESEFIERIFPSELRGVSGKKAADVLLSIKEGGK